jgi:gliding motility-associated protein GldM
MAGNNLSPRQKMIGMMYLVLTALLALNVSKEVLNAFQNVNGGIVRTTENFNSKNAEVYNQFLIAAETNPAKAGPWKDKAFRVKSKSDSISALIQKLKYEIVLSADNKVTFSGLVEPLTTPYDDLPNNLKNLLMVDI